MVGIILYKGAPSSPDSLLIFCAIYFRINTVKVKKLRVAR